METVDETVSRAQAMVAPSTNVPVAAIENNAPPALNIPQPTVPQVDASAALATSDQLTGSIQEQNLQQEQARADQAGTRLSDSERAIREAVGIIGTEGQARTQLEESAGMTQMKQQLNQLSNDLFNRTAQLRAFDLQSVEHMNAKEVEASRRDITKRTFASISREEQVKIGLERARLVSGIHETQATVHLLQGNIQMAAESIDKALQAIYEPKRQELQMEMMFFQRNAQLFDAAENRVANARMMGIQREMFEMDRAEDAVTRVTEMGYATPGEIQEMMKAETPFEQTKIAREIYARGAMQERQMDMALRQAQLAKMYNDLAPSSQGDDSERQLSINELEQLNNMGYKLPMGSTVGDAINAGVVPGQGTGEPSEFARMVINNPTLMSEMTATERGNVLREIAAAGGQFQTQAQESALRMQREALASVEDLIGGDETNFFSRAKKDAQLRSGSGLRGLTYYIPGSGGRQFSTKLDTLKAQMELPNLQFLAGMGRMSQEQFKTLQRATSNLDARNLSNAEMRRQLNTIRETLQQGIEESEKRGSSSLPSSTSDGDYNAYLQLINQ
jgi:hypothetical protein